MAVAGQIAVKGDFTGGSGGPKTIAPTAVTIAAGVEDVRTYALANGDNTITVPSGTTMVTLAIPITAQTIKMGPGATAAFTICANPAAALFACFPCTSSSFVLNASGSVTIVADFC